MLAAVDASPDGIAEAKDELWALLVHGRRTAQVTQKAFARRIGVSQQAVSRLEARGAAGYRVATLRDYVNALVGWAEPIGGPPARDADGAPLTPEAEARHARRRAQWRESQARWRAGHPEEANEYARRYRSSPRGKAYQREYGKRRRAARKGGESSRTDE